MYAVELDQSKRLLVITAAAKVTANEAKMAAQRIRGGDPVERARRYLAAVPPAIAGQEGFGFYTVTAITVVVATILIGRRSG